MIYDESEEFCLHHEDAIKLVYTKDLVKVCPKCGKKYTKEDNFCSQHEDAIKLVFLEDLVKICPKCGKKYTKEDNFCSQHDYAINLVLISDLVKECRICGAKYPKEYDYCIRCESKEPLTSIFKTPKVKDIKTNPNNGYNFYDFSNSLSDIEELLSPVNVDKLREFNLAESQFLDIIDNIKTTYKSVLDNLIETYHIDIDSLSTLDKILLFSKSFVKTYYKEGGGDLGHYAFNEIHIDDRATDAMQITTIIHELSHFLLAEILEQVISIILDTNKTEAVEAFVAYLLVNKLNYLIDEYCAHTVEGRFALYGYQDYGSYEQVLSEFLEQYSPEHVNVANSIGNTFAYYIKDIMESFIDEKLRSDIKEEYSRINDVPNYSKLKYETSVIFDWQRFSKSIRIMLTENIDEFTGNPEDMEKLRLYTIKFKENNGE